MFCGKNHGIICAMEQELYQLKFQNIDLIGGQWKFDKIINDDFWRSSITSSWFTLRLIYLPNDTIFAMQPNQYKLKCGIFDLKQMKWREIPDFENERSSDTICACHDEFRGYMIYVVDDAGYVSVYDLFNDCWKYPVKSFSMDTELNLNRHIVCWMEDENTLCCSDGEWFGSIDVTKPDDIWNENSDTVALARSINGIVPQWGYRIFV